MNNQNKHHKNDGNDESARYAYFRIQNLKVTVIKSPGISKKNPITFNSAPTVIYRALTNHIYGEHRKMANTEEMN